jgi:hypothetical protein
VIKNKIIKPGKFYSGKIIATLSKIKMNEIPKNGNPNTI